MANPSVVSGEMLARAMQTQRLHFTRRANWEKVDWGRSAIGASCQQGGYHTTKANTMQLQSILNRIQKHPGFVYDRARFVERGGKARIIVAIRERRGCRPVCSGCVASVVATIGSGSAGIGSFRCGPSPCTSRMRRGGATAHDVESALNCFRGRRVSSR
jgi:hypothetical protein